MLWTLRIAFVLLALYGACLATLYLGQRKLMYFPMGSQGSAAEEGFTAAQTLTLTTVDGERLVAWYVPAAADKPLFLYFHGNGNLLRGRVTPFKELTADGAGLLAIDYRGYDGSTGSPSEEGLLKDGEAAYAGARERGYEPNRIVIVGESLGTGVAVAVAANHPSKALILDSAFSATLDVAETRFWMFPIRLIMKDTFKSRDRIGRVTAPVLFLHGEEDPVIPIAFDRALFAQANEPKTFVALPGLTHVVLMVPPVVARAKEWVDGLH